MARYLFLFLMMVHSLSACALCGTSKISWVDTYLNVLAKDDGQLSSTLSALARISLAVDTPISDFLPTAKEWCAANVYGLGGLLSYAERNGRLPWADAE